MPNVAIAQIIGVFGVRGELKCRPTSAGADAMVQARRCFLDSEGKGQVTITHARRHHGQLILTLGDVGTVEAAQALVGASLYLPREELALAPDEYLDDDLVGLRLLDPTGRALGTVAGVEHYPAQDCLVIEPGRALVPLVRDFVRAIDLAQREITMDLPVGLLDTREAEEA
ncbi:MAG TPA: ribosome maturation factor RimM [Candidatus Acidoferrales bacterium]|nr:ribosome maturation factor RimM [Candidatus Acidoferrales bacterium]